MKFKNILLILFVFTVLLISINSSSAVTNGNINATLLNDNSENIQTINDILSVDENEKLGDGDVIIVDSDDAHGSSIHNEMSNPTIQKAIDNAKSGDTIIINGENYEHCHFIINKKLTIKSNVGTKLTPCSSTRESGNVGVFYLTSNAVGSVIEGFTISDELTSTKFYGLGDYGIYVNGADNVVIRNCSIDTDGNAESIRLVNSKNTLIENVSLFNSINGISIKNSNGVSVKNSILRNNQYGINIVSSYMSTIEENNIFSNDICGICVGEGASYTVIRYNNITKNRLSGVNTTSANHVHVLSNYIAENGFGVYVNCNIINVEIKGNFFNQNSVYDVCNDYRVRNLVDENGVAHENLEIIDNNYMIGHDDRPVYTITYNKVGNNQGSYVYGTENDVYNYVGENKGNYVQGKTVSFLRYIFAISEYLNCPSIFNNYPKRWYEGNYFLKLSEITQVKKGVYSISIINDKGQIASDISSVPVTFYLNKQGLSVSPQEGDIYKTVMMKNGVATVRFYADEFNQTGNIITAVFPTDTPNINDEISKTFKVDDSLIPGVTIVTVLSVTGLETYPHSNQYVVATLKDEFGNSVPGETLTFTINSQVINIITDDNGEAKFNIDISVEGKYTLNVDYVGDQIDYYSSHASSNIIVRKTKTSIVSSNMNMVPKLAEYFTIMLIDELGNALSHQNVIFKINGKSYYMATDASGFASIKLKFSTNKKSHKISIFCPGDNKYNSVSKTNKIKVKYSSKKAKLSTPNVVIPPKTTKYYTVSLKDSNGKSIKKQRVYVKINGKTYNKKTNSKGQINIKVKFSKLKKYKVSASFKGNKIYKKAKSKGKITVAKTTTVIDAPSITLLPKESKTYKVTLKANDKPLAKQKLNINIAGKSYTKVTDNDGQISLDVSFESENQYSVNVKYGGNTIYKPSKFTSSISVSKLSSQIDSRDKIFSKNTLNDFKITLKDASGNALANQEIKFTINGQNYIKSTDLNGQAILTLTDLTSGVFDITTRFDGNDIFREVSKTNKITISDKLDTLFVDPNLSNSEIQNILNKANDGFNVEFLGNSYDDISLNIEKELNIYSNVGTLLNAKLNSPVFNIISDNVSVNGFNLQGNSYEAIIVDGVTSVSLSNNTILNKLDESKLKSYLDGTVNLPGYGVSVLNSRDVKLLKNNIKLFESGIYAKDSSNITIDDNIIRENNYGIKYGYGVFNTKIINNEIADCIGLYIMTVPEGPSGYGIFLNNSGVNVTINNNHIYSNHIGISLDANHTTGIVITQNTITDNVLEGIRFNAGYDLVENAIQPHVTDNAIYRNARGPSMMILGELSANPEGIYGGGLFNASKKLQLEANWYGTNQIVTWDNDTGVVGYGTMCPRINTTEIKFINLTYNSFGNYSIVFYKNNEIASNLPKFDMYATLNRGTDKEIEVIFDVVNGVATFKFDSLNFYSQNNTIEISIGSLINSTLRAFKPTYTYVVPENEIKI